MWPESTGTSRTCLRSYFRMGKTVEWGAGMLVTCLRNHQHVFTPEREGATVGRHRRCEKGSRRAESQEHFRGAGAPPVAQWRSSGLAAERQGRQASTGTPMAKNSPPPDQKRKKPGVQKPAGLLCHCLHLLPERRGCPRCQQALNFKVSLV